MGREPRLEVEAGDERFATKMVDGERGRPGSSPTANRAGTNANLGGEVFEISHLPSGATVAGGYGDHTISRPSNTNTSPLMQPTYAFRVQ